MVWFFLIGYILLSIGLYFIFTKAGEEGWKGLVPGLNLVVWSKLIGRPRWWPLLLLIPIVNIFIYCGMIIDLVRSFDKLKFFHSFLAVVAGPIYSILLGTNKTDQFVSPILDREKKYVHKIHEAKSKNKTRSYEQLVQKNPYKKSVAREWVESIIFAVFAAAFIRMFLIEAYVIPTSSMEGSLLVGDFLFVSKAHYGIRPPMTIAMVPLLHNRIPIINTESYLEKPSLPYRRLPALETIDNNDPIVFNWPVGDSVYVTSQRSWTARQVKTISQAQAAARGKKLITRPLDKKDHYIKRCIGIPGDSVEIKDRQVYINGKMAENPENMQFKYLVGSNTSQVNQKLLERLGVSLTDSYQPGTYHLNNEQAEKIKQSDPNLIVQLLPAGGGDMFPHDPENFPDWTFDNYGPIYIPKKGVTVSISPQTLALYRRVISVYEHNDLRVEGDQIYINGELADSYTFKQDYYWAMGDNRHNSEDSRAWGFVPHDHIVGKPLFIWFSTKNGSIKNGIRWNRLFKSASNI